MIKSGKILIVDDNKSVLNSLKLFLKYKFKQVDICSNPNQIPSLLHHTDYNIVLLDMNFKAGLNTGNEGLFWLKEILKKDSNIVVLLFTAYGDIELAVNAIKEGATDFILKPWDNKKLLATIESGIELNKSRKEISSLKEQQKIIQNDINSSYPDFLGKSDSMKRVFNTIRKVAKTDANILILGENGTGKELVAREIHNCSTRENNIFMGVDLGALSEPLFESELFGHKKGAFTDAKEDRKGRFQTASKGTLFLDEIGNLSLPMQGKLLSTLQNREITPLGANKAEAIDVRLVCATNKNLSKMIDDGDFREDLLYRINTIQIELPPLRERGEDITILAKHYIDIFTRKYEKPKLKLSKQVINSLNAYHWAGNVRELKHAMERAVILSDGGELTELDFNLNKRAKVETTTDTPISLEDSEKAIIANSMKRHNGNISHVAKELKIGRQTLYRKIEKYGI